MAAAHSQKNDRLRILLLLAPAIILLLLLIVVPTATMIRYSFNTYIGGGRDASGFSLENWKMFFSDPYYYLGLWKTMRIAVEATVIAVFIAYPVAYTIAFSSRVWRPFLLILLVLPFWISFIIRNLAWINILGERGAINALLMGLGLTDSPLKLLYTEFSVILGILSFVLPYIILNIYVSLDGIDRNLLHAARTLGCTSWQAFLEITLPLSFPGLCSGVLLSLVLAAGTYITPALLGGPDNFMFGNIIADTISLELNWPMGAVLSLALTFLLLLLTAIYSRFLGIGSITKGLTR
ncbi:ABC transporter permease [Agrobacterium sp. S2/73]|uniref:ABC transporter permease n=1 Tax=Agrobacterium sp. S7/73 TaxID=2820002 RepID=UPI001AD996B6|nr:MULTISPECIES: ABC transporter permease [Rhizobium/Agrobacterium group]MBO9112589.1 ABC transporter permease [Agrobacterium sp. S2/73]QXZ76091.1 ABC transporter permease [Agrobacterium sp. S7/73]QYA16904.1 ABC transporter permease [Rhizobium sp. AB2/73]UEQ85524.1 ABC transporter permease [Rhizobium sp. AB2/73]